MATVDKFGRTTGVRRKDLGKVLKWQTSVSNGWMSMNEYRKRINGLGKVSNNGG